MNRNAHNLRGSSVNPAPRWRIVFIALVLALVVGSAGQRRSAQAAPAGISAYFSMRVRNPKTTLRCGQTVTYHVVVDAAPSRLPTPSPSDLGIPRGISIVGVYVEADSTDKSVGDFVGAGRVRTTVSLDSELTTLTAAKFKFKGNKPGKTTLYFDGLVGTAHVAVQLDVTVLPCKFKAKTVLEFSTGFYNLTGISSDAVMIADEQGHLTGSASMYWAYSNVISGGGPCRYSMLATDSQVDLVGQLDEDGGQVMTTATFQPTTVSSTVDCGIAAGTGDESATVHPLTFTVDSSGGVSTQTATAEGIHGGLELEGPVSGTARVILIPQEDDGIAFSADSWAALDPLEWLARLWRDNFPSLFSTLLALH